MTNIILPNQSRTKTDPVLSADWYENDVAIKEVVEGELDNDNLSGSAGITEGNLAKLGSPKLAPTVGSAAATENLTLTTSYQDVPGGKLEITPTAAGKLLVVTVFTFAVESGVPVESVTALGTLKLDSESEQAALAELIFGSEEEVQEEMTATATQVYALTLTAAAHTIKMRAKRGASGTGLCKATSSRMLYALFAS